MTLIFFLSCHGPQTLLNTINSELVLVKSWIQANKLSLNIKKTNDMIFSKTIDHLPGPIQINGIELECVQSTKFLGIHVDHKLSRNIGVINHVKNIFTLQVLSSIYTTLILPYLNYGILALGNPCKTLNDRILILQKRALRIIHNVYFRSHTNHLFLQDKILKINDSYSWYLGVFISQLINNEYPLPIASIFPKNNKIHSYPTRQSNHFHTP